MDFLIIYVADNCKACTKAVTSAKAIIDNLPNVTLKIKNIREAKRGVTIVPAVFFNQTLFCYGELDEVKLIKLILENTEQELL